MSRRTGASLGRAITGSFRRTSRPRAADRGLENKLNEETKSAGAAASRRVENSLEDEETKAIFMLRLKYGIPVYLYVGKGRGKKRKAKQAELVSTTDGRTISVKVVDAERFNELVSSSKRLMETNDVQAIAAAIPDRRKEAKMTARQEKGSHLNLRTVDIKEIWQADVEYGSLDKHTIIEWPDGTALDLEGSDQEDATFLHHGLTLCLDDWTQHTAEYSDFWDSM